MGSKRKRMAKEPISTDAQPSKKRSKMASEDGASKGTTKPKSKVKALDKSPFTEKPTIQDRKRELELYELLGNEDGSERITAADAIVSGLLGGDGVAQPVLERHLEKRLFRGLASGRNASRLGFSLVITEIISQLFGEKDLAGEKYPGLSFDKVLGMLVDKTQAGGNVSGQEERDCYFGQLFGIECFVRSGILFSDKRRWMAVLDLVLNLAQKKMWLRSQCGYIVVQAISQMKKKLAEKTLEKLAEEGFAKTPEGVGIWIAALDQFPDILAPPQPWQNPLAAASLSSLPAVLKESGREQQSEANGSKIKQGGWSAQLHFVWDLILARFVKIAAREPDAAEQFKQFWKRVVDEGFFSKTCSEYQKFSGFVIFQKMLEGIAGSPDMVTALFSQNFMGCLMNQAAREDRYLHRAALKALKAIEGAVEKHKELLPTILRQLLSEHGVYNFDQRTNTKTVDKLLQNTNPQTVKAVIKLLKLKNPIKSGLDEDKYYQALGSYLFRLASTSEAGDGESSRSVAGTAMELLAELAYSNKLVPAKLKEQLRTKCTSAFAKLARRPEDFGHLCGAILSIEIEADGDQDENAWSALSRAYERLRELLDPAKGSERTKTQRQALALLHAVGILQFHNEDPDAIDLLDELEEFYNKVAVDDAEEDEGVSEFMVEILLAMVARPSSLMRQVSQQVFEAFTSLMSAEALNLLTDPLAADESAKGQQALFSTEDEDMADAAAADEDGSDEEDLDSDVEIVNLEEAGSDVEDSVTDSDAEEDDDENENEEAEDKNQEALDALDNALAEALGSHRLDKDAEAESGDESDMTDSEMMEMDAKLAEIFKQRAKMTNKKKERKDAKETVINFKHRILDLLTIFVKKEAALMNPLVFESLLPLLRLVRTTSTKALGNKACEAILSLSKALKKARSSRVESNNIDADRLMTLLGEIHDEASKNPAHAFAKAASTASLAVASVLCATDEKRSDVFQLYAQTQMKCYEAKVKIQQAFFLDWLNWCQGHASVAAAQAS